MIEWSALSARARDKLVAEEVMGRNPSRLQREAPPAYSTDLAAAWEVVDRLKYLHFVLVRYALPQHGYSAGFSDMGDIDDTLGEARWVADALTAAEAICLAALQASGVRLVP